MLKKIFESILPDNIKNIPLIKDAVDIFVTNLEENSALSIQIRNMFESDNTIIKENLFKIYLNSIYNIIKELQTDKTVLEKLEASGRVNALIYKDIKDILNDEYFVTTKMFKQTKGTRLGIEYAFNFGKKLEGNTDPTEFSLVDVKPFHFRTEGNIFKETYEKVVKPLSHPVGFTNVYHAIVKDSLVDLFGFKYVYDINNIEVRCLDGYFDVFTSASDDSVIKADFLTRTNRLTGDLFTEQEYNTYVTVFLNKIVQDFDSSSDVDGVRFNILFTDGTFLKQQVNPLKVYYRNYSDELLGNDVYIRNYTGHCSLYVDYVRDYEFTFTDSQSYKIDFSVDNVNDQGMAYVDSDIYCSILDDEHCFKVGGDLYTLVEGVDEGAPVDNSTASYVEYTIGELVDGTFSPPDTLVNGLYTEGNDYSLNISNTKDQAMFINSGRTMYPTNSFECLLMTNSEDVLDDLSITQVPASGVYLVSDESGTGSVYFTKYNSLTTYSFGQYVEESGLYYAMINDSTTVQGVLPSSDTSNVYWQNIDPTLNGFYLMFSNSELYLCASSI